jgi:hypothetical protein
MKTISDHQESLSLLAKYSGANAQIWAFNATLKRLLIKLTKTGDPQILFVIVVGCEHINGPFSWENSNITVSKVTGEDGDTTTWIKDSQANFELVSIGGFALAQGTEGDFGKSFVNFSVW